MWGYETVSDAWREWLGPAVLVLVGMCVMITVRWPIVGLFASVVVLLFVLSNIFLTSVFARPLNLKSVALDSRIGGGMARSIDPDATAENLCAEPARAAGAAL